jgi:hypothetical protein
MTNLFREEMSKKRSLTMSLSGFEAEEMELEKRNKEIVRDFKNKMKQDKLFPHGLYSTQGMRQPEES